MDNHLPVMSFGKRLRDHSDTLFPVALIPPAFIGLTVFIGLMVMASDPFEHKVIPAALAGIVGFVIIAVVSVPLFHIAANESAQERDKKLLKDAEKMQREQAEFETLRIDLRLPLLEWAVKNDRVEQIEGLDARIAYAVQRHYQRRDNAAIVPPPPPTSSL